MVCEASEFLRQRRSPLGSLYIIRVGNIIEWIYSKGESKKKLRVFDNGIQSLTKHLQEISILFLLRYLAHCSYCISVTTRFLIPKYYSIWKELSQTGKYRYGLHHMKLL